MRTRSRLRKRRFDGNKRIAWVVARVFLADNGGRRRFELFDAIRTMERVPAGTVSEAPATRFRDRLGA